VSILLLASCAHRPPASEPLALVRRSQPLLGTFVTITAYGPSEAAAGEAVQRAFDQFRKVDALMSIHRVDSELAKVNQQAGSAPVKISAELFGALEESILIWRHSHGAFDITIAPLTQLWGFVWKQHRFPNETEIQAARAKVGAQFVQLDADASTVRFTAPGVSLDLGGIGKGYAVDRAIEELQRSGIKAAMVKAGGDLRVFGTPPGQRGWEVQIEDPGKAKNRLSLVLREGALSTSGSYENYFMHEGKRYSHILDPRTGWPIEGVVSCTVIAPTCIESDAWATAYFVLGPQKAASFRFPHLMMIENGGSIDRVSSPAFPAVEAVPR